MAPTHDADMVFRPHLLQHLSTRAASNPNNPPLASVFALVIDRARALAASASQKLARSIATRDVSRATAPIHKFTAIKRQSQILVIPTTYNNLNNSPAPAAVVGITLGAILGFLLIFFLVLLIFRQYSGGGGETIIQEEIIRRHSRGKSRTASSLSMSEVAIPPPVTTSRRESRRESRRVSRQSRRHDPETVVVEEEESNDPEVVVEEEEDDIVEVIEEHSPEPPPRRKKSGFRTVDPGRYGGGDAPSRRVSRR